MVGLAFVFYKLVRILIEFHREEKQASRKEKQTPSEPIKSFGVAFHSRRRLRVFLAYLGEKTRKGAYRISSAFPLLIQVPRAFDRIKVFLKRFILHKGSESAPAALPVNPPGLRLTGAEDRSVISTDQLAGSTKSKRKEFMRFLVAVLAVGLMGVGGFIAFGGMVATAGETTVFQQIASRIELVGGIAIAGIGITAFAVVVTADHLKDIETELYSLRKDGFSLKSSPKKIDVTDRAL